MGGMSQSMEDGACGIITCIAKADVASGDFYGPAGGQKAMAGAAVIIEPEAALTDQAQLDMLWAESEKAVGEFKLE